MTFKNKETGQTVSNRVIYQMEVNPAYEVVDREGEGDQKEIIFKTDGKTKAWKRVD